MYSKVEKLKGTKIWIGKNPELSKQIQKELFKLGFHWYSKGQVVFNTDSCFLSVESNYFIKHGVRSWAYMDNPNHEITVEDFFEIINGKKTMTKSELQTGMLVERENGNIKIVINEHLIDKNGHEPLRNYNEDLTHYNYSDWSINRVSYVNKGHKLRPEHWTKVTLDNNLMWERKSSNTQELTLQEIADQFNIPVEQLKIKK